MRRDTDFRDVCVVIPTYNEKATIGELITALEELRGDLNIRIVVVDDSSTDGTIDVIRMEMSRNANIIFVERGMRLGFGSAIRDGLYTALSLEPRPEFIVTMDGDLSHDPLEVLSLVSACSRDKIVVGSRYIESGKIHGWGLYRKTMSRAANLLARIFMKIPVRDCTSGFRCYSADFVRAILPSLESEGFDIQIETLYKAIQKGFKIEERPITFRDRLNGKSKVRFRDIWGYIRRVSLAR